MNGKKTISAGFRAFPRKRIPGTVPGVILGLLLLLNLPVFARGARDTAGSGGPGGEVIVWTYDSFNSEWGPGPEVKKRFEAETGITLTWVNHGDAGAILARLLLEGKDAGADVILGLDQNLAGRALNSGLLEAYRPVGVEQVFPELIIDEDFRLTPLDYSYFAVVYDSERIPNPPKNLEELTLPEYGKKLILMDPRTSSPGLGFLTWTKAVYGNGWTDYWRRLTPSMLTIADGWDTGYGLFTAGEAPLVLSYTTSPGYHLEYEGTERYRAAIFSDGHPIQIEAAGLLAAGKNKEKGKRFLDFMLSPSFQDLIPLTNWMYPVTPIPLPDSFRINPKSDKPLRPAPVTEGELSEWAALMSQNTGQ
ncbi:MAG: thiamine ABC transporter substrate-binding protein [Spirochaetaceae bacterium]|nr:thiamine ABC transporter substrate-binding protein [Spirochaetaceae bacterium]